MTMPYVEYRFSRSNIKLYEFSGSLSTAARAGDYAIFWATVGSLLSLERSTDWEYAATHFTWRGNVNGIRYCRWCSGDSPFSRTLSGAGVNGRDYAASGQMRHHRFTGGLPTPRARRRVHLHCDYYSVGE